MCRGWGHELVRVGVDVRVGDACEGLLVGVRRQSEGGAPATHPGHRQASVVGRTQRHVVIDHIPDVGPEAQGEPRCKTALAEPQEVHLLPLVARISRIAWMMYSADT